MLGRGGDRDRGSYEKLSIRDSARSLKKYGSTSSKASTKNETYLKHFVSNSDTLQGIALRYNVTIEQIRRANKLWASDSLFLRESLLIPVPEDHPEIAVSTSSLSESQSSTSLTSPASDSQNRSSMSSTRSSFEEENINDFLSKIDASIASTKEVVKKVSTRSDFAPLDTDPASLHRKPAMSRMKQTLNNNSTTANNDTAHNRRSAHEFYNPSHNLDRVTGNTNDLGSTADFTQSAGDFRKFSNDFVKSSSQESHQSQPLPSNRVVMQQQQGKKEEDLTQATAILQNLGRIGEGAQIHYPVTVVEHENQHHISNSDGNLQIITQQSEETTDTAFAYVIQSEYINENGETTIEYRLADQLGEGQHYVVEEYATQYEEDSQGNIFETVYVHQEGARLQNSVGVTEDGYTLREEELCHPLTQHNDSYEEEGQMTIVEEQEICETEQQEAIEKEDDGTYFKQETTDSSSSFAMEQENDDMDTIQNDPLAIKQEIVDQQFNGDDDQTTIKLLSHFNKNTETIDRNKDTESAHHDEDLYPQSYPTNTYSIISESISLEEREQLAQNVSLDKEALALRIADKELQEEKEREQEEQMILAKLKNKKRSERLNKLMKNYVCFVCFQEFKSPAGVKMHMAAKHSNKEQTNTESEDEQDETRVDVLNFETCFCCGEPSDSAHTIGDFKCEQCDKLFIHEVSLKRHCSIEHPVDETFTCAECLKVFNGKQDLIDHMRVHALNSVRCEDCGSRFSKKCHLERHIKQTGCMADSKPVYECRVCSKSFSRKDNLGQHLKTHLGTAKPKKSHVCEYCERHFSSKTMLVIHYRTHTGEKPYDCDVCQKKFPSSGALRKHRRMHTGEKPYVCLKCNKSFAAKETFNRHWKTHSGLKPHTCQFCGKSFIQATQLRAHIFHHTGENAFTCPYCGRAFNRKLRLTTHIKFLHEGAQPLKCPNVGCDKTFFRREDMVRHSLVHTGEKPHTCKICDKSFSTKSSLKTHMFTHQAEKPVSCEACKRAFKRQDCLIRHMRAKHRDVLEDIVASAEKKRIKERLMDIAGEYHTKEKLNNNLVWNELSLTESVKELLSLLVDADCLKDFGHPDAPVDKVLCAVIKRCGHEPASEEKFDYIERMRENAKMLFTVVVDDSAMKDLLTNQTVDEVISHVIKLARHNTKEDSKEDILNALDHQSQLIEDIKEALDSEAEDNPEYLDENLDPEEDGHSGDQINTENPTETSLETRNVINDADFDGDDVFMEEERLYDENNGEMIVFNEAEEDSKMEYQAEEKVGIREEKIEFNEADIVENVDFNEDAFNQEIVEFDEAQKGRVIEYIHEPFEGDVYDEDDTTQEKIIIHVVNESTGN